MSLNGMDPDKAHDLADVIAILYQIMKEDMLSDDEAKRQCRSVEHDRRQRFACIDADNR